MRAVVLGEFQETLAESETVQQFEGQRISIPIGRMIAGRTTSSRSINLPDFFDSANRPLMKHAILPDSK
jgi:hypothetical protein